MGETRVITTEPLAVDFDDQTGFTLVRPGTVCVIETRFEDGTVDLRTVEGDMTIPSVTPDQYEVDQ